MELRSLPPLETSSRVATAPETATPEQTLIPEEDFRLLFEHSLTISLVLRPDFTIVAANKERLRATRTKLQDVLGRNVFEAFPDNPHLSNPTGVQNLRASLERVLRTGMPDSMPLQRYDVRRSPPDENEFEERWWSVLNSPVVDEKGEIKYIMHRIADVTEDVLLRRQNQAQHKIAAELRQQAEEKEQKISISERNLQYTSQQLLENNEQLFRKQAQVNEANTKLDAYAQDLETRVRERTARLEAAIKASRDLLYTMAHDLRAPLRAMRGFTEALADEYATHLDEMGADYVRRIHQSAGRMDQLIADLLEYGRVAHVPLSFARINLEEELAVVLDQFALVIEQCHATVQVDRPLPGVCGDKLLVQQVLRNLIDNALKFVAPQTIPHLHIYAVGAEDYVRLWIVDNGIGIDPAYREKIFGIFQRLHRGNEYPGRGFGLALVQRSIEHMHGRVGVESQPGHGSRFWIELPDEMHCENPIGKA
ncbi:MAG: domain S-box [Verrucomicrobiales bacterium]|nr:domain S-box [Verrucomicrobiales bacterium]